MKIQATKNYKLFKRHDAENRPLDARKHATLKESMKKYGYLKCYPIVCYRDKNGNLVVKDGQHRLLLAEELGLSVYWVLAEQDFDVAFIAATTRGWQKIDFALKYAANGIASYDEILQLHERYKIGVSQCAQLLSGSSTFVNISKAFHNGTFKVRDKKWAESLAAVYARLFGISNKIRDGFCLSALMGCFRVPQFDPDRLLHNAERCREKFVKYGSREGYLQMLEDVYNFGRSKLFGLKLAAIMAMRERNPATKGKSKKKNDAA